MSLIMFHLRSNKGFASMTEIIVTGIIFVVTAAGILSAVVSIRPKGNSSAKKLNAAYAAKAQVEELRARIDARMWDDINSQIKDGQSYNGTCSGLSCAWSLVDVSPAGTPAGTLRKLTMNVTY
jgi:hypothetical protein